MAEYINFEGEVEFDSGKYDVNDEICSDSENAFLDDEENFIGMMRQTSIDFKMLKMTLNRC